MAAPEPPVPLASPTVMTLDRLADAIVRGADRARIGLAIVIVDGETPTIAYLSDAAVDILGRPREELIAMGPLAFLAPESQAPASATLEARRRGEALPPTFELVAVTRDGRRVTVEVTALPITVDGHPASMALFRDISERKQAVADLARSEARFRHLIENAPDAVWMFDGARLRFVNATAVKMLGYDEPAQLMALSPRDFVHPDDGRAMAERTREMVASGKPMEPRDYRTYRRDGEMVLVEVRSFPIEFEGSKGILSFGRDVTGRRRLEAQLVQADRLAALGTLTAGIAHEINNPLTYAVLGLDLALRSLASLPAADETVAGLRQRLEEVRTGTDRVAGIVRQLRAFSRSGPEARAMVDVRASLAAAARIADHEIRHRARLELDYEDVPDVHACAARLEQVFLNLLINAAQALPEGEAHRHRIRLATRRAADGGVAVEISDTGPGIPPDVLPRIFDPFFTTKPVGVGTGLGLSICHSIVTSHGGTIDVDSDPGRGTTFRVLLPAAPASVPSDPRAPIPPAGG